MNKIITISRQYGSGGREIGAKLAEKFGIPFYDNALIEMAAKESGFSEKYFEDPEKNASNSFLYSIVRGMQYQYRNATPWSLEETVYTTQSDIIRKKADEGPCVIIGRCADHILSDYENVIKIFVHADLSFRMDRAVKIDGIDPKDVKDHVAKKDKRRMNYYNYHSDTKWGDALSYDLCIDSSICGIDKAVAIIADFIGE
ncbi:MAG: cytidylate kinase-like family protein [Ruminococcaceae bacterium]|nr:cytidylate kinase-like family protein [Oscillospiraceae bacterium]